jgi:hypothetical protein
MIPVVADANRKLYVAERPAFRRSEGMFSSQSEGMFSSQSDG